MSIRTDIVAKLVAALPATWYVIPAYRAPDAVTAPTVLVYRSQNDRIPTAGTSTRPLITATLTATLVTGIEATEEADDALDDTLDTLALAIEGIPGLIWTTSERIVLEDRWHGWRLTLTTHAKLEPEA